MPFSIGFGVGPLRWSHRFGGRGILASARPPTAEEALGATVGALGTVGAWGAIEGLAGNWGVTGRVFGVVFILGTVLSVLDRRALAVFLTSWVFWVLAELGYFRLFAWIFDRPFFDIGADLSEAGIDAFMLILLKGAAGLGLLYLMILLPPLIVWRFAKFVSNPRVESAV